MIYYGIIKQWVNKNPKGFDNSFDHKSKNILGDCQERVSETKDHASFTIKYKILKEK